jgi:N6-L-threonylcarbamoyladenine synthase
VAGGVSANSGLRDELKSKAELLGWNLFVPDFRYTTDNAAMIAITGYYKYLKNEFASHDMTPFARMVIN